MYKIVLVIKIMFLLIDIRLLHLLLEECLLVLWSKEGNLLLRKMLQEIMEGFQDARLLKKKANLYLSREIILSRLPRVESRSKRRRKVSRDQYQASA